MRVNSAEILAFDFGELETVESYMSETIGEDDLSIPDDKPFPLMYEFETSFNTFGTIENENSPFDTLYVSVFRFASIPDTAALILSGDVSEYSNDTESVLEAQDLQEQLKEIWMENFDDFPSGISIDSPGTLISGQIMVDSLDSLFQIPDHNENIENLRNHRPFVESIRDESFCRTLGIEHLGMMSVEGGQEEYLMLTAETVRGSTATQIDYGQFAVLEFLPQGSLHRSMSKLEIDKVPPMGPGISKNRMGEIIEPLFYHHWLQERAHYRKMELRNKLRNIPRTIRDSDELNSIIESVQNERTNFYTTYTKFLDKADAAEDMLDRMSRIGAKESGVPLLPAQTSSERSDIESMNFNSDDESGILVLIAGNIRSRLENERNQYEMMKQRYDTVFEEMGQKFDLEIARKNQRLSESSVDLQREVQILNWLVAGLTLILAGKEIGSVLGFW